MLIVQCSVFSFHSFYLLGSAGRVKPSKHIPSAPWFGLGAILGAWSTKASQDWSTDFSSVARHIAHNSSIMFVATASKRSTKVSRHAMSSLTLSAHLAKEILSPPAASSASHCVASHCHLSPQIYFRLPFHPPAFLLLLFFLLPLVHLILSVLALILVPVPFPLSSSSSSSISSSAASFSSFSSFFLLPSFSSSSSSSYY